MGFELIWKADKYRTRRSAIEERRILMNMLSLRLSTAERRTVKIGGLTALRKPRAEDRLAALAAIFPVWIGIAPAD